MESLAFLPMLFGVFGWFYALVSYILAITHRLPEQSLMSHLVGGYKIFDASNFTPEGQKHRRHCLIGMAVFLGSVLLTVLLGALLGAFA